jgi:hypothetical protein
MRLRMLRGENLTNPIIRKKVLGENTSWKQHKLCTQQTTMTIQVIMLKLELA